MDIARVLWRWVPVVGITALLCAVTAAAALTSTQVTKMPQWSPPSAAPSPASTLPPTGTPATRGPDFEFADSAGLPSWLLVAAVTLAVTLALAVVAAIGWTVVRRSIRVRVRPLPRPVPVVDPVNAAGEVRAAVQAGIDALDDDGDPRRAVIACWVGLEAAAAKAGTARGSGDTPTELVRRLLATHEVSPEVLEEFAELYRMARYAPHDVDENMRMRARSALTYLHAELLQAVDA